jgi:hypothetical protein
MHIHVGNKDIVFCAMSPIAESYGDLDNPIWTIYMDGSFARMCNGGHYRSPPNKIRKPAMEYTLQDLWEIIHGNEKP